MQIGNFNLTKGFGKFLLGALAMGITLILQNPELITSLIPEKIATMTIVGLVFEVLDFILHKIKE